jgi:hypothetical protein
VEAAAEVLEELVRRESIATLGPDAERALRGCYDDAAKTGTHREPICLPPRPQKASLAQMHPRSANALLLISHEHLTLFSPLQLLIIIISLWYKELLAWCDMY